MIVRLFAFNTYRLSSVLREILLGSGNHSPCYTWPDTLFIRSTNIYNLHVFIILITVCAVTVQLSGIRRENITKGNRNFTEKN